ncbi:hypothetical protein POV27_07850 [Aureisphaera galaxeae]|uniref:hypothetical protein n=1 Tax=Aureisphaera galaxeae TaxID=1538023 RepID=UPI0023500E7D|nr:hypothetical protein [Aureisphaera galaxeae]MDC8003962.1 hypothetical protein [Aureisphaera galaxeae]
MNFLRRMENGIRALKKEITKPDSFSKGEEFEEYVRKVLFPQARFQLIDKTHGYNTNREDFVESSLKPDFKFRDTKNGQEFYVEAKWRNGSYNRDNKLQWCNKNQLRRYKDIDQYESKVFVVLGLGNSPKRPEEVVLFPMSSCNFNSLYDSFLSKYSFYLGRPVFSGYLWNLR